jgi:thiol-disulfide isomerase/thioredoxin
VTAKTRPAPKRPTSKPAGKPASGGRAAPTQTAVRRRLPLVGIFVVVIAVLLVGAIVATAISRHNKTDVAQTRPVTVAGTALPELKQSGADAAVGQVAPILRGENFDGKAQTVGGPSDKPTLAMFVAHWCPHCQAEVPRVVSWRADGTIPSDINLVAVSTAASPDYPNYPPSAWLHRVGWPGQVMADDDQQTAAQAYGLPAYPFFVALDKDGKVLARGSGELDQAAVKAIVRKLQAS